MDVSKWSAEGAGDGKIIKRVRLELGLRKNKSDLFKKLKRPAIGKGISNNILTALSKFIITLLGGQSYY